MNWHLSNAFTRLGASSRAEAVALAMREEAQRADAQRGMPERPAGRPPLPLSAIALAVAVTLVLGLLGGALMAGWNFTSPTPSPSAPVAPSSGAGRTANPTVRPLVGPPGSAGAPAMPGLPTLSPLPSVLPVRLPLR